MQFFLIQFILIGTSYAFFSVLSWIFKISPNSSTNSLIMKFIIRTIMKHDHYFQCHQMNNAWIINSYMLFITDGFSGLLRHVSIFSIKDSVSAWIKMELSHDFFRGYNLMYSYVFQAYLSNNNNDFYIYFYLI